ncbi:hypothetical protein ACHAQH_002439 [Verticillium albo-atrum]
MRLVPVTGSDTSSDPDMVGWNGLPAELKALTLNFAIASAQQKPKAHHLASYAVVCKDWQEAVEPANFASLRVALGDIADFVSLVIGPRRRYLKHLLLGIELPKYPKKKARVPETDDEQTDNDIAFSTNIINLFEVLAEWKIEESNGLEVELCARSPSDTQAMSGAAGISEEGESRYFDSHLDFSFVDTGWVGQHGLPSVDVITKLSILRRCWRNIDATAVLTLVSSLPRLTEVRYEPFQQFDDGAQEVIDMDRARFLPFWPSTIRRLSLFEHFDHPEDEPSSGLVDENGNPVTDDDGFEDEDEIGVEGGHGNDAASQHDSIDEAEPRTCAALAITIARRSLQLEELAVSFMADARHFFQPFFDIRPARQSETLPQWPRLRWLTLTSSAIHYDEDPDQLNALFLAAARAARRMPQLRALELYSVCKHSGGVFRYAVRGDTASLAWEGTWDFVLGEGVKRAWREVARANASAELEIAPEYTIPRYEGMFKFVHTNLWTREMVLHGVSSLEVLRNKTFLPPAQLRLK